jgi:hypothetical protein
MNFRRTFRSRRIGVPLVVGGICVWTGVACGTYKFRNAECVTEDPCDGNCILMYVPGTTTCLAYRCASSTTMQQFCKDVSGTKKCGSGVMVQISCTGCKSWTCTHDSPSGECTTDDGTGGDCRCSVGDGLDMTQTPRVGQPCITIN